MYNAIRLFVEGNELEFSKVPQILYNYKVTDFQNPTTYINGYSKGIQVEGTERNNDIFGHIWRLDNEQTYNGNFNAYKRAGFQLFVNGELYEKGYCKLTNITKTGNKILYDLSLYCGVGNFFYSLTYLGDDSDAKMTLRDILPLEDFKINKEVVNQAWNDLGNNELGSQWSTLNFALTSEGIPEDFDSEKVLVNLWGTRMSGESGSYQAILNGNLNPYGYALGEMPFEMVVDNTMDLRSYLLRPVLRVKKVIEACTNPAYNGGYQINLDDHFFAGDNPYYEDAWMTLHSIKELEIQKEETGTTYGSISNTGSNYRNVTIGPNPLDVVPAGAEMNVRIQFQPTDSTSALELFTNTMVDTSTFGSDVSKVWKQYTNSSVCVQLYAFDSQDNVVGVSDVYSLASSQYMAQTKAKLSTLYTGEKENVGVREINGSFKRIGGYYYFCDESGEEIAIKIKLNARYSRLALYVETPYTNSTAYAAGPTGRWVYKSTPNNTPLPLYTIQHYQTDTHYSYEDALALNRVRGNIVLSLADGVITLSNKANTTFLSNTTIPMDKLLATDFTPCDFLLSYCKMFGLYFYQNPQEEALDPINCPNGVIHICDRNTFYTEQVDNLHQLIDRGKEMKINPAVAKSKWYEFKLEGIDSEAEENFKKTYGYDYGRQLIDTAYEFDSKTNELYEGNVFRNGVQVQEKNKFFNYGASGYPAYFYGGLNYSLFKPGQDGYDTTSIEFPRMSLKSVPINSDGLPYYDSMSKLQVHSEDLGSNDGSYVLLFFDGMRSMAAENGMAVLYSLTDDLDDMAIVNDGNPCWFWSQTQFNGAGEVVAIKRNILPFFTRDIVRGGNIIHSWNFGHPRETFVPNTYTTEGDSIYDKCWKDYIGDLYSVNDRQLSCYVRLLGRPNPDLMRRYFWFDNAIWRLNEIKDWDLNTNTTTLCEFIKVQDMNNYTLQRITKVGRTVLNIATEIGSSGGTLTGTMVSQNSSERWAFEDTGKIYVGDGSEQSIWTSQYVSPMTGTGIETYVRINIPANTSEYSRTFHFSYVGSDDEHISVDILQAGKLVSKLYFEPSSYRRNASAGTMGLTFVAENMITSSLTVSKDVSWLGTPSISGTSRVLITNEQNSTTESRTGYVTIQGTGADGLGIQAIAAITQSGQEYEPGWVEFDNASQTIPYQSGTTDEHFTYANMDMSALRVYGGDGWATPRIQSATSEVFVDYTENAGSDTRTTTITLYGYDRQGIRRATHLTLTQNAQPQQTIFVNPTEVDMTYVNMYGGNLTITGTSGNYNITITDN